MLEGEMHVADLAGYKNICLVNYKVWGTRTGSYGCRVHRGIDGVKTTNGTVIFPNEEMAVAWMMFVKKYGE